MVVARTVKDTEENNLGELSRSSGLVSNRRGRTSTPRTPSLSDSIVKTLVCRLHLFPQSTSVDRRLQNRRYVLCQKSNEGQRSFEKRIVRPLGLMVVVNTGRHRCQRVINSTVRKLHSILHRDKKSSFSDSVVVGG